jgi:predicted Fe-Mo cluster-binding NifX family protein
MRIAVCAKEASEFSPVADRFARTEYFVIYDHSTLTFTPIENDAKEESGGAGGKAVKLLNTHNVDIVLSPEVGSKVLEALKAFEIEAYNYTHASTVKDAIYLYFEQKLRPILVPHNKKHK